MKNEQRRIDRAFSRVAGFCDLTEDFENWEHFDLYRHAERTLRYDVLYQSHMHGPCRDRRRCPTKAPCPLR